MLELESVGRVENRDAIAYRFAIQAEPHGPLKTLAVLFSGTVYSVSALAFDLPEVNSKRDRFTQFALAAVGDALDSGPLPENEGGVAQVECFSPSFQDWKDRGVQDPAVIHRYLGAHAYWAWEFNTGHVSFGMPDLLRLGVPLQRLRSEAQLYDGEEWNLEGESDRRLAIKAGSELVRRIRAESRGAQEADLLSGQAESDQEGSKKAGAETGQVAGLPYVDESRIAELRLIESDDFDLSRLVTFCEELNLCYRSQAYLAVAGLLRALVDHIPPIFGMKTFSEVANNYGGGATFKRNAKRLDEAARDVGNLNLHRQIARKETVPSRPQIHFAPELDIVLEEVVRLLG